jgi:REP element-mobilizing transposase RayT
MRKSQLELEILKKDGTPDLRSKRWQKVPSFAKLHRQGHAGGEIRYRKGQRPFDSDKALHAVLKSALCTTEFNFSQPQTKLKLEEIIRELGQKTNIKVYKIAIAKDHIHILLHAKRLSSLRRFLRAISGVLAKRMRKWAKLRKIKLKAGAFWSARPYTTLVNFGKHWRNVLGYLEKNRLEAAGFIVYTPRNHPIQKVLKKIIDRLRKQTSLYSSA